MRIYLEHFTLKMSNLYLMDESNGNGVYGSRRTTMASNNMDNSNIIMMHHNNNNNNNNNNVNLNNSVNNNNNNNNNSYSNIMVAAASNVAASGGCVGVTLASAISTEDLSQSLSEYTDADESISAPTEFLAEFLSAVMLKDYKKALKYCKLILQYEPNNATAKEFYPLILDKLAGTGSSDSDENYNKSSSPEFVLEVHSSEPVSAEESDEADVPEVANMLRIGLAVVNNTDTYDNSSGIDNNSNVSSSDNSNADGHGISVSLSDSVEDDIVGVDDDEDDDDEDEDDDIDDEDDVDDEEDIISSSGDDLPIDEHHILSSEVLEMESSARNCDAVIDEAQSSHNSSNGGKGTSSRSDNTTHSYSSLLLEEEDDIVPTSLHFPKDLNTYDLDVSNGNKLPSTSCSDSESPTEPLTQRLAAILQSKCGTTGKAEG